MDAIQVMELTDVFPTGFAAVKPELKVLLVYQDFEMGVLGKQVFDLIAREAGNECAARLTVWRFDFFHSPQLTVAASQQAEEADVIIFAPRDPNWLPPQIKAWLERWPQRRKHHTGALIGVFHPAVGAQARSSDVALLLLRAASRAEMEFFFRAGTTTTTSSEAPRPANPEPFTITRSTRPQYRNWGVNE